MKEIKQSLYGNQWFSREKIITSNIPLEWSWQCLYRTAAGKFFVVEEWGALCNNVVLLTVKPRKPGSQLLPLWQINRKYCLRMSGLPLETMTDSVPVGNIKNTVLSSKSATIFSIQNSSNCTQLVAQNLCTVPAEENESNKLGIHNLAKHTNICSSQKYDAIP